jgi:hypothetical protein
VSKRTHPLPDLKLKKRADGWWIVGHPHWDPKYEGQGPYPTKKDASEEKSNAMRNYRSGNWSCDPMAGYEWRAENLVSVWNVAEGDTKNYTRQVGGDAKGSKKAVLVRQSSFGIQVAPRDWQNKSRSELAKLGIFGFRLPEVKKAKLTIVISKKRRSEQKQRKVVIVIPKRKKHKKRPVVVIKRKRKRKGFSWKDYGLDF